jgi:hypothetical protein
MLNAVASSSYLDVQIRALLANDGMARCNSIVERDWQAPSVWLWAAQEQSQHDAKVEG